MSLRCWTPAAKRPAIVPAISAVRKIRRSIERQIRPSVTRPSMTGKRESVPNVMRRVVNRRRAGEPDAVDHKGAKQDRHQRGQCSAECYRRKMDGGRVKHRCARVRKGAGATLAESAGL